MGSYLRRYTPAALAAVTLLGVAAACRNNDARAGAGDTAAATAGPAAAGRPTAAGGRVLSATAVAGTPRRREHVPHAEGFLLTA